MSNEIIRNKTGEDLEKLMIENSDLVERKVRNKRDIAYMVEMLRVSKKEEYRLHKEIVDTVFKNSDHIDIFETDSINGHKIFNNLKRNKNGVKIAVDADSIICLKRNYINGVWDLSCGYMCGRTDYESVRSLVDEYNKIRQDNAALSKKILSAEYI